MPIVSVMLGDRRLSERTRADPIWLIHRGDKVASPAQNRVIGATAKGSLICL